MWDGPGHFWPAPGGVPTLRKAEEESCGTREDSRADLQGSRSHGSVQCQTQGHDVAVSSMDDRAIEVLASGLPFHHGAQLVVDITLRSVLTRCGNACNQADRVDGVVLARARLNESMLSCSTGTGAIWWWASRGGRWSPEALHFVDTLAATRAREAPPTHSAYLAWVRRWSRMLAVSCGRSFAHSLISPPAVDLQGTDGPLPDLADFQDCLAE